MAYYKLHSNGVIRNYDGAFIPSNESNKDWLEYQKWLLTPNIPDPADPAPTNEELFRIEIFINQVSRMLNPSSIVTLAPYQRSLESYILTKNFSGAKTFIYDLLSGGTATVSDYTIIKKSFADQGINIESHSTIRYISSEAKVS